MMSGASAVICFAKYLRRRLKLNAGAVSVFILFLSRNWLRFTKKSVLWNNAFLVLENSSGLAFRLRLIFKLASKKLK